MKIIGYEYAFLNKTQFTIVLGIFVGFCLVWTDHVMRETVRTVPVDKIVYKDRVVNKCDASEVYKDEMSAAKTMCDTHPVAEFTVDLSEKPRVKCLP